MKNTTSLVVIALIVFIGGYVVYSNLGSNNSGSDINSEEVQKITLGMKNYNYYPNTIRVKAGIPVELTLDSSVRGCYRAFTIRQLGISQISSSPSDKIIFTLTEKGTYSFACSMGMGYGTIIVE
ncbi:MAG: cupredoxin domain-containing protein [archaeon]|nr:cupredoxin domain-containing protein [archaeon]